MDRTNKDAAVEALIQWFRSQDISPDDSVDVMATTICVAVVSIAKAENLSKHQIVEGINAASHHVLASFDEMLEGNRQ